MKIFKKIFKIKFTFKIPTKKKFLIYDLYSEKILSKILNDYNIIPTRFENLSILIFAYSLIVNFKDTFKLKNIYFNYLKTFIDFTQPLCVITFIDNDKKFFRFKKYFKNIKFIAIQNGYRFYKNDLFEAIQNSNFIFECDEYYCYGENIKNYLKNKVKANIYPIGSLKNNYCSINNNITKKNLCFISSFGISNHKYEKLLLNIIYEFCQKKGVNLEILARRKSEEEKEFFHNILQNKKFIFHRQKDEFCSSYSIIDKAEICISLNATLGYESLARGNKTFFFNLNDRNLNCSSFTKFGYPEKFQDEGFFWTNKFDPSKAIKNIDYIYNLSEKEWKSMSHEIIKKIIIYDANNQFFQERLSQF